MQNRPSQVNSCTTASCFMVDGIARTAPTTSRTRCPTPPLARFSAWKAARSAGGSSDVVNTVHSTHARNTTAPAWNAYLTVSGIPLGVSPTTPRRLSTHGSALARLAPTPMNSDCMTNPEVRCGPSSLSATKARNGSIDTLMLASSTQSSEAAMSTEVLVGITNRATDARTAPVRK
jgi:hypothetical protein